MGILKKDDDDEENDLVSLPKKWFDFMAAKMVQD